MDAKPLVNKITATNILDKLVDVCSHINLVIKNYALIQKSESLLNKHNKLIFICDNVILCCDIQSVLAELINQIVDVDKNAFLNSANKLERVEIINKLKLFDLDIDDIIKRKCKDLDFDIKVLKELKSFLDNGCFVSVVGLQIKK